MSEGVIKSVAWQWLRVGERNTTDFRFSVRRGIFSPPRALISMINRFHYGKAFSEEWHLAQDM